MGVTDELVSEEIEAWLVAPSISSTNDELCVEGTSEIFVIDVGEAIRAASVAFTASAIRDALVLSAPEFVVAVCERIEFRSAWI